MTGSTKGPKKPGPRQAHNDKFHNFKDCVKCGVNKRLADFALVGNWRKKRAADPKRYSPKCKECSRAPSAVEVDPGFKPDRKPARRTYTKRRSAAETRAWRAEYQRKARRKVRIKALEYLAEKGCCECGERDPRVLEFDHIDPAEKANDICTFLGSGYSWGSEILRAEIRKCRVICANCHRVHTSKQQEHYGHDDVQEALDRLLRRHDIEK